MQNRFQKMGCHRKMNLVEVRMGRMVLLMQQKEVDHDDIVNNTYHQNHRPIRNYPFDDVSRSKQSKKVKGNENDD